MPIYVADMPIEDFILPGVGTAANIIGGVIARGQALKDARTARSQYLEDRAYNEPKNQLARMREAGLPSAAYFTGGASSQSAPNPVMPYETDNNIASAGENISRYQSTRLQRIQVEAAEENLAILKNQRKISDVNTQDELEEVYPNTVNQEPYIQRPRVIDNKRKEEMFKAANTAGKDLANSFQEIVNKYEDDKRKGDKEIGEQNLKKATAEAIDAETTKLSNQLGYELDLNDQEFKKNIQKIRRTLYTAITEGKMPNWKELGLLLLYALENRL